MPPTSLMNALRRYRSCEASPKGQTAHEMTEPCPPCLCSRRSSRARHRGSHRRRETLRRHRRSAFPRRRGNHHRLHGNHRHRALLRHAERMRISAHKQAQQMQSMQTGFWRRWIFSFRLPPPNDWGRSHRFGPGGSKDAARPNGAT